MNALWTLDAFLDAVKGEVVGSVSGDVHGLSIDTRTLSAGDAFFAIKGDQFDGHVFVDKALETGAVLAVVSKAGDYSGPHVIVDDVLSALERLAVAARTRSSARIVAVTGSVGKTSTKDALSLVLSDQGKTHAAVASFNNHWGVPLTLARMPEDADYGVFEIGMNAPDEIRPLVGMVRPHVAIITTVAPVHLAQFSSVSDIADAKAEIFEGLVEDGVAVLNADNEFFDYLATKAAAAGVDRVLSCSMEKGANTRVQSIVPRTDGSVVDAEICGDRMHYRLGAPGRHMVANSLLLLTAVKVLGADLAQAGLSLAKFQATRGRGEQFTLSRRGVDFTLIDESYNANPVSMKAAITLLAETDVKPGGRRIAVLGDMLELGSKSADFHAGLADVLIASDIDAIYCSGSDMKHLWDALPSNRQGAYAETSDGLVEVLKRDVSGGDAVMIKGSLGSRMGPLVQMLKQEFGLKQGAGPV